MKQLILDSTHLAQWQSLVHEALASCDRQLDEALENYLLFLLMRFTRKPHSSARVMAEDYLQAFVCRRGARIGRLRDVGDHCLLFSVLFPQLAEHRLVNISNFINLGKSAYTQFSGLLECGWASVYGHLSEVFQPALLTADFRCAYSNRPDTTTQANTLKPRFIV